MKIFLLVIVFFVLTSHYIVAATSPTNPPRYEETVLKQAPISQNFVVEESKLGDVDRDYITLLEKVNQQLTSNLAPYNVTIGIITALLAVGAIIASILIFLQSREYKDRLKKDRESFEQKVKLFFEEHNRRAEQENADRKAKLEKLDERFVEFEKKMSTFKDGAPSADELSKLKKELQDIRNERQDAYGLKTVSMSTVLAEPFHFGLNNIHKCSHCGFGFQVIGALPSMTGLGVAGVASYSAKCPKCGNTDLI